MNYRKTINTERSIPFLIRIRFDMNLLQNTDNFRALLFFVEKMDLDLSTS